MLRPGDNPPEKKDSVDFTILNVSDYDPPHVPSKTWRELIMKVWDVDPLICPRCGSEMRIISLIQDPDVIRQILKHLGLWKQDTGSRCKKPKPDHGPVAPACRQTGMRNLMTCLRAPACHVRDADRDTHRQAAGPHTKNRINPPLISVQLIFTGSYFGHVRAKYGVWCLAVPFQSKSQKAISYHLI